LTETGMIMGTPEYMSPEQARGRTVDARADIYSTGAMLFELLSGRPPFEGESFVDILVKQTSEPPPILTSLVRELPPSIDAVMARMLAKRADDRFADMQQVMAALRECDRDTFRGDMLISGPTERPESMLPRASGPQEVLAALRRPSRAGAMALVATGIVAAGIVVAGGLAGDDVSREVEVDPPPDVTVAAAEPNGMESQNEDEVRRSPPTVAPKNAPPVIPPARTPPQVEEHEPKATEDEPAPQTGAASSPEARSNEPSTTSPEGKRPPGPRSATSSKKKWEAELRRRIQAECEVGFQARKLTIEKASEQEAPTVLVAPSYGLLHDCAIAKLRGLPPGIYHLKIAPPRDEGAPRKPGSGDAKTTDPFK
jgi:serine/threonine-protein kinase